MSLKYSPSSIVGGPLSTGVLNLLKSRQDILGKRLHRTDKELTYLNSNTGWVKMTSSVDTRIENGTDQKYTSDLAQRYVMLGGTLYENAIRTGIFPDSKSARSSYELSPTLGYRPMPGINTFQVNSKNQFGTLRQAVLEFRANSVEQLGELEQLYLRPGFTVLVEWGHSLYLDKAGAVQSNIQTVGEEYFNYSNKEQVYEKIKTLKEAGNYNYDAMFGFIKNFNWTYNRDGGYDCRVDVISTGELIESVQLALEVGIQNQTQEAVNYTLEESCTPLHSYLHNILSIQDSDDINDLNQELFGTVKTKLEQNNRELKVYTAHINRDQQGTLVEQFAKYIPLSNLLAMMNEVYSIKTGNSRLVTFYIGNEKEIVTPFTTFKQHFLLDPSKGFLPKEVDQNTNFKYKFASIASQIGAYDDILNICINVNFILEILNSKINNSENTDSTVIDFINALLKELTFELGFINDFSTHYEEQTSKHYIIDRSVVPDNDVLQESVIDTVGLGSTVENLQFSSKLSNNIATMMAISAQANSTDAGEELLNLQRWNYGLQDRIIPRKTYSQVNGDGGVNKEKIQVFKLVEYLGSTDETLVNGKYKLKVNETDLLGLRPLHKKLMSKFVETYTTKTNTNAPGLIPLELSLTLQGVGGLKVGQAFLIPHEILPSRYTEETAEKNKSKIAFIITGLDNKIDNGRWLTDIRTQMILTSKKQEGEVEELEAELEILKKSDLIYDATSTAGLTLVKPLAGANTIRNDARTPTSYGGGGHYMSSRSRGKHKGTDIIAPPGSTVYAPFKCSVKIGRTGTLLPKLILQGLDEYSDYMAIYNYVEPRKEIVDNIDNIIIPAGVDIGKVVQLAGRESNGTKYGYWFTTSEGTQVPDTMTNHLDIKLFYRNSPADPEKEFPF